MTISWKTGLVVATSALLFGCGGGLEEVKTERVTTMSVDDVEADSAFHTAPIILESPPNKKSGQNGPDVFSIPEEFARVNTRNLSTDDIRGLYDNQRRVAFSSGSTPKTYSLQVHTPANIRMAYGLPPIPTAQEIATLTPEQRADLGAGQTIFIITAYNHPNLMQDLELFNNTFGLPQCSQFYIPLNATSLAPANPSDGCTIAIVHNNKVGTHMTLSPPPYNSRWARETALDVQWAHATAPLARIVVLQALNNFTNSLLDMIILANRFGPGTVSMSFVAGEGSYSERYDQFFNAPGMTYFAAAGDFETQANWPATSPNVIAVGGTTLRSFTDTGVRNETAWSRSGGGYSGYFPAPAYQSGLPETTARTVKQAAQRNRVPRATSDVAFNADALTGQYTVFTPSGGTTVWFSMGGTSIGTPQWAGIIASINANRSLLGRQPIGKFHQQLYTTIGPGVGSAAQSFNDITVGSNGTCSLCQAQFRFDLPTGWGTPNYKNLASVLVNN